MFDYTDKNVCMRELYCRHMQEEINRVKKMQGKCLSWYVDPQPKDEIWMEDSVKWLKGAGRAKGDNLVAAGIATVSVMKAKSDTELLTSSPELQGISFIKLVEWRGHPSHLRACQYTIVDHRITANPYYSQYNSFWEEDIKKTTFMRQYVCVRDLVQHIHDYSKKTLQGTVHESN